MKRKKIPYESKVPVTLTVRQSELIKDHTFYDGDLEDIGVVEGNTMRLELTLDEIEEIQEFVAAAANHCESTKLVKELDKLFDALQKYLDTYDDQSE